MIAYPGIEVAGLPGRRRLLVRADEFEQTSRRVRSDRVRCGFGGRGSATPRSDRRTVQSSRASRRLARPFPFCLLSAAYSSFELVCFDSSANPRAIR